MKIGISRHFPVPHNQYTMMGKTKFINWIDWYDHGAAVAIPPHQDITDDWDVCYYSGLPRTKTTAETLYKKEIHILPELLEVPFCAFPLNIPLPLFAWKVLARIGWWLGMKFQTESRKESLNRVKSVISYILKKHENQRVFLVSHGFFMQYLNKELHRQGFTGSIPIHPKGGTVYLFDRQ
ncbi:MAG: histidine phosphatase family protein [Fibrobacteria bacterium]|nr:histidine phosphatase family protein [Fibrobacteria bacterium]